ncbi:transcriptional regulator [Sinorhizobium meliloti CCNWSX0020]|uniref:Transcriptional regulator n=1 Tax=Sinorhizobium meliloti CCNWSX0020 TaxID=1107881 RepID=H0FTY8_RHIML|nr:transcriptional regulator [Sinorhizobium meliloti CCNWSX0020]
MARDIPFINVGIYNPSQPHASIGVDNEAAAHRAMMHLIEIGHRRIGVVSALQRNNDRASARIRGFKRALAENGLDLPAEWHVEVRYTLDDAREAARQILTRNHVPTAIACGNDVLAYGVMLEAEGRGLSVPTDLSVVGFDDLEWSRHLRPDAACADGPDLERRRRIHPGTPRRSPGAQSLRGRLFAGRAGIHGATISEDGPVGLEEV